MSTVRLTASGSVVASCLIGGFTSALAQHDVAASHTGHATFHVAQTFMVGGEGGWDYITVDPAAKLLYLPRTTHTMVLDEKTGRTIADIPGQRRSHGVVLVPSAGRGFISDGEDASVTIFDLKTHRVLGNVKAADDADAIAFDPASGMVLVSCGDAGVLVPIAADVDPVNGEAGTPIALGGKPEFLVSDLHGRVYVNLEDQDEVAVVDMKSMEVVEKWSVSPGGAPVGLAMDHERGRLFIGCRKPQKLVVLSAVDGEVLAHLPIGAGVDAVRFDNGFAFASCRDGTLAVASEVSPGKYELVQTVKTWTGARTMDVDPLTHVMYLPTAGPEPPMDARSGPTPMSGSLVILVVRGE